MAEKKDPIRSLIDTGRRAGKLTSSGELAILSPDTK